MRGVKEREFHVLDLALAAAARALELCELRDLRTALAVNAIVFRFERAGRLRGLMRCVWTKVSLNETACAKNKTKRRS